MLSMRLCLETAHLAGSGDGAVHTVSKSTLSAQSCVYMVPRMRDHDRGAALKQLDNFGCVCEKGVLASVLYAPAD